MASKIAVINDLSGFGRCSLTAAIPVISVMGSQPCPLPTAILSAQTGYPSYYIDDFTDRMDHFREEWAKQGERFDGIYTGFLANEAQIDRINAFLDTFLRPETFLLVDPVLGDNGEPYPVFSRELLRKMRGLAARADVLTPNLTELCLLAGIDYREICDLEISELTKAVEEIVRGLEYKESQTVVITGIACHGPSGRENTLSGSRSAEPRVGNLICTGGSTRLVSFPKVGGSFSGTGDLFASVLAGGLARGDSIPELCELAGRFIEQSMTDSLQAGVPSIGGTEFERNLYMLLPSSVR